jgi:hypothetical protein
LVSWLKESRAQNYERNRKTPTNLATGRFCARQSVLSGSDWGSDTPVFGDIEQDAIGEGKEGHPAHGEEMIARGVDFQALGLARDPGVHVVLAPFNSFAMRVSKRRPMLVLRSQASRNAFFFEAWSIKRFSREGVFSLLGLAIYCLLYAHETRIARFIFNYLFYAYETTI